MKTKCDSLHIVSKPSFVFILIDLDETMLLLFLQTVSAVPISCCHFISGHMVSF